MRTVRTGLIGFGLAGQVFHAPLILADPACSLDVVVTGDPQRRAAAPPGCAVVATPEELWDRAADLDLVVIASPPATHVEHARAALGRGLAVVVDKPFAPSVAEATSVIELAEACGIPLSVFQSRRWDGDFLTVQALVRSGSLGRIHRFESTLERASNIRSDWQVQTPVRAGGGVTFDLGSHLVDQAIALFGQASLEHAELGYVHPGRDNDDDAFLSLLHESGVRSHVTVSRVAGRAAPRFRVLGTEGSYSVDGLDGQEAALKAGARPGDPGFGVTAPAGWGRQVHGTGRPRRVPTERGDYPAFYAGMAGAVLRGGPVPVEPRDVLACLTILEEAHRRFGRRTAPVASGAPSTSPPTRNER